MTKARNKINDMKNLAWIEVHSQLPDIILNTIWVQIGCEVRKQIRNSGIVNCWIQQLLDYESRPNYI